MSGSRVLTLCIAVSFILGLVSCATHTALETSWQLPNSGGAPFKKLAVIGIMRDDTESTALESAIVDKLSHNGIQAIPGFSVLNGEKKLAKEEMEKRVAGTGADAVLLFKVIAVDKERNYVPPTTYVIPTGSSSEWWQDKYWGYYNPYPHGYFGYWYPAVQVTATPGYWESSTAYRVESTLYRTSDNKLVWTAVSDTYDPKNQVDLGGSLAGAILEKLERAGLIPRG
jgi:hypothetical protein